MSTIQVSINNRLVVITLNRGRSNPINHQMVKDLTNCINEFDADDNVGGAVITGKTGFFSSGIDLIEAYDYDEAQIKQFWIDFLALPAALASFKKPLVAAINGHSPAGGCVIALCCDYRVMVEGPFIIGLNEIPVGIIVPNSIFALYSFWLSKRKAYQYLLEGKLLNTAEALDAGLIDEVCTDADLQALAEQKARAYMKLNPATWSMSKQNLRAGITSKLKAEQSGTLDAMLKQWWAPATRKGLQMMIENLKAKSAK